MKPLFSFIIPVYNTEKYLTRCLDSVFAQICKDFEVIVVDDCSPGDCAGIVKSYPKHIHYLRQDRNRSLLQARILGGKLATGKYLISLDSDDFVSPELTQALEDEIKAASEPDIVVYHMVTDDGTRQAPAWHNQPAMRISARDMLEKVFAAEVFWPMCGKAVRRDTYLKALDWLGVNADFYLNSTEDLCQMLPVLLCSQRASFIEYVGYHYWHNSESLSKSEFTYERLESYANQSQKCVDTLLAALKSKGKHLDLMPKVQSLIVPTIRWFLQEIDNKCDSEWNRCVDMLIKIHDAKMVVPIALRTATDFLGRYQPDSALFRSQLSASIETIGVLCHHVVGGGAERATLLWAHKMAASGKRIVFMCDANASPKEHDLLAADGIVVAPVPVDQHSRVVEIGRRILEFKVDVVLLVDHWLERMFGDFLTAKSFGCRAIIADHSSYFFPLDDLRPQIYRFREKYYPLADAVTVLSPANVSWYHAAGVRNVVYMPNFLTFDVPCETELPEFPVNGDVELLVVGTFCARKNVVALLEAFSSFRQLWCGANRRCRLTFLGRFRTPQYEQIVREAIVRLRLCGYVVLAGEHDDVAAFFSRTTIMLMASRLEGAPMVLMEAKSHAVPTVMFSLPYVSATDERDGVVTVPFGDTEAMARAVYDCVSNPARYQALSVAARKSLEEFSSERIMARWERVFSMMASGKVEPLCEPPPAADMLEMTMKCMSLVAPVFDVERKRRDAELKSRDAELKKQDVELKKRDAELKSRDAELKKRDVELKKKDAELKRRDEELRKRDVTLKKQDAELKKQDVELKKRDLQLARLTSDLSVARQKVQSAAASAGAWRREASRLENSRSYKIGRMVTWPYRMVRNAGRCYRENGFLYTLGRIPKKFANLWRRFFG